MFSEEKNNEDSPVHSPWPAAWSMNDCTVRSRYHHYTNFSEACDKHTGKFKRRRIFRVLKHFKLGYLYPEHIL